MAYTFKHGDRPLEGITIQRAVGRGGFGEVYYALTDSGKQVAVKYLRDNPEIELRGVAHTMNLKSPHLITIYDVRQNDDGEPFVIMEYISGPSLHELLIAESGGLGAQKAAFFLKGIARGLAYLHERGIVHRDMKPGNIFYDDGYVKIGDYGLSKHMSVSKHSGQTVSVGTVHYMAPEIGSGNYTKAIDVYALGVILYEMLTGRLPFTGSSMGEVLMRHLSDNPNMAGIPEPFKAVIVKALAKDPRDRYQDVEEMAEQLLAAEHVSASVATFDPSVFSSVSRSEPVEEQHRTLTAGGRRPAAPNLDAREAGLPEIPPIPPLLDEKSAKKARKLQQKAEKLRQRAQIVQRHVAARFDGLDPHTPAARERWPQALLVIILTLAMATAMGMTAGGRDAPQLAVAVGLITLGGVVGSLFAYSVLIKRLITPNTLMDRLVYAATAFVFMIPGFAVGWEANANGIDGERLIIPLLVTLALFNWTERIEDGRRRIVDGESAFWHALLGLIAAGVADLDGLVWVACLMCGALPLLTQATAAMWPMPTGAAPPPPGGKRAAARPSAFVFKRRFGLPRSEKPRGWTDKLSGAVSQAARAAEAAGAAVERHLRPEVVDDRASQPAASRPAHAPMQPSFVGRTANAGLSLLGKLLLLTGVAAAVLFHARIDRIESGRGAFAYEQGLVKVEGVRGPVETHIPKAGILAPLVLGAVLLVAARRTDGVAHFLRGLLACFFTIAAAVVLLGPGADAMQAALTDNWGALESSGNGETLAGAAVMLALSFTLLFWPKRREHTIVI